ncbi:hypothetical protein BJX66DRAFT_303683 [Aspergillus keveii]|uniref:Uncharacterized protein n=1 Tax=Aspergillus keveii TaxID=714993 RepID=A0ABR4G686_9EURO
MFSNSFLLLRYSFESLKNPGSLIDTVAGCVLFLATSGMVILPQYVAKSITPKS